jgi:antirestriction protein ArdC
MAQAAGYRTPRFLTFKQALELGGNVRKGERGTKVFFVKQLQVRDLGSVGIQDSHPGLVVIQAMDGPIRVD